MLSGCRTLGNHRFARPALLCVGGGWCRGVWESQSPAGSAPPAARLLGELQSTQVSAGLCVKHRSEGRVRPGRPVHAEVWAHVTCNSPEPRGRESFRDVAYSWFSWSERTPISPALLNGYVAHDLSFRGKWRAVVRSGQLSALTLAPSFAGWFVPQGDSCS